MPCRPFLSLFVSLLLSFVTFTLFVPSNPIEMIRKEATQLPGSKLIATAGCPRGGQPRVLHEPDSEHGRAMETWGVSEHPWS